MLKKILLLNKFIRTCIKPEINKKIFLKIVVFLKVKTLSENVTHII